MKVYFNPKDFAEVAKLAEKSGKRRMGLQLYTQKPHGFSDEKLANTDGIARFMKMTVDYWIEHQEQLDQEVQETKKQVERLKKYGKL